MQESQEGIVLVSHFKHCKLDNFRVPLWHQNVRMSAFDIFENDRAAVPRMSQSRCTWDTLISIQANITNKGIKNA
jgi:hypothetical protein